MSTRPILLGYVALESWAEDFSEWDGIITGPHNPKGANLAWQDPIEMIEKRAYDEAFARAEKAETQLNGANENWDNMNEICTFLSAQVVALRGALRCSGSGDLCKLRPEHKCNACKTLELPIPELAQAVQGVIEAARRISPCNPMPDLKGNEFIGWEACTCYRCTALSSLDSLIRKKVNGYS